MPCFSHSDCIRQALGIGGVNTEVSTWLYDGDDEHKGAQIDMVLIRADNIINLCEMKFSKNEFSVNKEYDKRIRERTETFREVEKTRKVPPMDSSVTPTRTNFKVSSPPAN